MTAKSRSILRLALALGAVAWLGGCAMFSSPPPPRVVVDNSQLNRMTVRYRARNPAIKPVVLTVLGSGYIRVMRGMSPLVADDFAIDVDHPNWGDVDADTIGMSAAEARVILQHFADAGLMQEPEFPKDEAISADTLGVAEFRCNINGDKHRCVTTNPDLIGMVEMLLSLLGHPALE
jgi:hypothetical protein